MLRIKGAVACACEVDGLGRYIGGRELFTFCEVSEDACWVDQKCLFFYEFFCMGVGVDFESLRIVGPVYPLFSVLVMEKQSKPFGAFARFVLERNRLGCFKRHRSRHLSSHFAFLDCE